MRNEENDDKENEEQRNREQSKEKQRYDLLRFRGLSYSNRIEETPDAAHCQSYHKNNPKERKTE